MFERRDVPQGLLRLATHQGGVLTARQATEQIGRAALRRLVGTGAWTPVVPGVVATGRTCSDQGRLWVGHLLAGPGSALGGASALAHLGLLPTPRTVLTWVPAERRVSDRRGWEFRRDGLDRLTGVRGSLPTIRLEEALLDLAADCTIEEWAGLLADAIRDGHVRASEVWQRAKARPRLTNRVVVESILSDIGGIESTLEWVFRRDVQRRHALPTGLRQASRVGPWRTDVLFDEFGLAIELDGRHHARRWQRDLDKDNDHVVLGIGTLRYGSVDVRGRPCVVARQIASALQHRGWAGDLRRCPSCPI